MQTIRRLFLKMIIYIYIYTHTQGAAKKRTMTKILFSLKQIGNLRRNFQHLFGTYMPIFR